MAALLRAGSALAALQLRDIDGKATTIAADTEFAHDTVLDATWCLTANNTSLPWNNAKSWAAGLTVAAFSGWSLPAADPSCGFSYNSTNSQMGELYYTAHVVRQWSALEHRSLQELAVLRLLVGYGVSAGSRRRLGLRCRPWRPGRHPQGQTSCTPWLCALAMWPRHRSPGRSLCCCRVLQACCCGCGGGVLGLGRFRGLRPFDGLGPIAPGTSFPELPDGALRTPADLQGSAGPDRAVRGYAVDLAAAVTTPSRAAI